MLDPYSTARNSTDLLGAVAEACDSSYLALRRNNSKTHPHVKRFVHLSHLNAFRLNHAEYLLGLEGIGQVKAQPRKSFKIEKATSSDMCQSVHLTILINIEDL